MTRTTTRTARLPLTCLLTTGALVLAAAGPAAASVDEIDVIDSISVNASGVGCSVTSGGGASETDTVDPDEPFDLSTDTDATISNAGDPEDVTEVEAELDLEGEVADDDAAFGPIEVTAEGSASVDPALGDDAECGVSVVAQAGAVATVTVEEPGVVVMDAASTGHGLIGAILAGGPVDEMGTVATGPDAGTHETGFVPEGDYTVQAVAGLYVVRPAGSDPVERVGGGTVTIRFVPAGAAFGKTTGSGATYLTLPGAVNCDDQRLTATFTAKGASVKKAVFTVNGKQKATKQNPKKGTKVGLTGLPADKNVTVSVALTLDNGKLASLKRGYAACGD